MAELNNYELKIINEILSYKDFPITLVNNFTIFVILSFNRNTYPSIVNLIKLKDWQTLKDNKDECETDFTEDLILARFTNQDNQNCLATVYDSNELWQDPEIIEVFILN